MDDDDIIIPAEVIGDPEYDDDRETLTFHGSSAVLIARILSDAREKREQAERSDRVNDLVRRFARQYAHKDVSASRLVVAFNDFAFEVLKTYEVPR